MVQLSFCSQPRDDLYFVVTMVRVIRRVFWASVWLAMVLVAVKAYYLGVPPALALTDSGNYLRSLAAISYVDVLFAAIVWASGRAMLVLARRRPWATRAVGVFVIAFAAFSLRLRHCQRARVRGLRRIPDVSASGARRQRAHAQLVRLGVSDAARHHRARRRAAPVHRPHRGVGPPDAGEKRPMEAPPRRGLRVARRLDDPRRLRILRRVDNQAGPADCRQPAVGAHFLVVAGRHRGRNRAAGRPVSGRRSQGFRAARRAAALASGRPPPHQDHRPADAARAGRPMSS